MKTIASIITPLLLAGGALSLDIDIGCQGDTYNNWCCVNGQFSGSVISSFSASFSSVDASLASIGPSIISAVASAIPDPSTATNDASVSLALASLHASLSSEFEKRAEVTPAPRLAGRAITTQVEPGLTCIGDALSSVVQVGDSLTVAPTSTGTARPSYVSSGASAVNTAKASGNGTVATATASHVQANAGPIMTQAPFVIAGAAAALVYGAL